MREGEQTSGVSFSTSEKLNITRLVLCELNVPRIEIASARVSSGEFESVKSVCDWARATNNIHKNVTTLDVSFFREAPFNKIIVELAERLQDVGIQALTIHGRTRCQMYRGEADWTLIGQVKANPRMHIPIIGNGDITDGPGAVQAFGRYGVDGIMIGRATFGHPWIFREIKYYMEHGEPMPEPGIAEKVELARTHLDLSLKFKGEPRGIYEMRRHLSCYFKGLPDFKQTRMRMVTTLDRQELYSIFDEILQTYDR